MISILQLNVSHLITIIAVALQSNPSLNGSYSHNNDEHETEKLIHSAQPNLLSSLLRYATHLQNHLGKYDMVVCNKRRASSSHADDECSVCASLSMAGVLRKMVILFCTDVCMF